MTQNYTIQEEVISFKVEKGYKEFLKNAAESEFRNMTGFIRNALDFYLKNKGNGYFEPTKKEMAIFRDGNEQISKGNVYKYDKNDFAKK